MSEGRFLKDGVHAMRYRILLITLPLILLFAALACAGCVSVNGQADSTGPTPVDLPVHTLTLDEVRDLSMSIQSKSEMATGFPVPLPVIDGKVLEARLLPVEGVGDWVYTIEVSESPKTVFEWYSRAYPIANWQIDSAYETAEDGATTTTLEMMKGSAHSHITISPAGSGTQVEAQISIGGEDAITL